MYDVYTDLLKRRAATYQQVACSRTVYPARSRRPSGVSTRSITSIASWAREESESSGST
ncbi:hypothetical protein ACFQV4_11430 [Streptomyces thermocarboxydus]